MELEEQIKVVAEARRDALKLSNEKKRAHDKWETENSEMLSEVSATAVIVSMAEDLLRELTLKAYVETGNKAPAVGVGIRDITTYSYDVAEALAWAKEHKLCLKLDDNAFKKQVKATPKDLPFVTSKTEPQATIAQDLS